MKDCKTCIWFGKEKPGQCGNYLCRNQSEYDPRKGFEEEAVNDYIKRADVLELVMRGNLASNRNYKSVMRLIMGIPAADVREDVRARWKGAGLGDYSCSWCGEVVSGNNHNFCPNCGAKMGT